MRLLPIAAGVLCWQTLTAPAPAQSTLPSDLGVGKLLVASRDLSDPNFARTVVLLVQYDDDGVVGLIVNRRSEVPVSRVLEKVAGAQHRTEAVYAGGPVSPTEVLALLRSPKPPDDAKHVVGDVFLVSSKGTLEHAFATAVAADRVHIYIGYSGWTAPQLEHELDLGAWFIFQGNAAAVFDAQPDALWPRLIRETEMRVARAAPASAH